MSRESYSDFSIIKNYVELKNKYDDEVKIFREKIRNIEEKFKKHVIILENEIKKRNEQLKTYETKNKELSSQISEKDEQLKNLGLQLHRLKLSSQQDMDQTDK